MFKNWLKQLCVVLIALIIVVSPIAPVFMGNNIVRAEDYTESDTDDDDGSTYYIVEGQGVADLFDFSLSDVEDLYKWIWSFRTFTVIKEMDDGTFKCYFNTPNLQQYAKNQVTQIVPDGYVDETFDINQTQWLVDVGEGDEGTPLAETAITKYGFQIPNYTYLGEYPRETLSIAGIIPTPQVGVFQFWWRCVKALFGASFLEAPSADNFNTIKYMNHTYKDGSDYVVQFFQQYYLPYFVEQIAEDSVEGDDYFSDTDNLLEETIYQSAYDAATIYCQQHLTEYTMYCFYRDYMEAFDGNYGYANTSYYYTNGTTPETYDSGSHKNNFDGFEDYDFGWFGLQSISGTTMFLTNDNIYQTAVTNWLQADSDNQNIMFIANAAYWNNVNSTNWTNLGWTSPSDIALPPNPLDTGTPVEQAKTDLNNLGNMLVGLNDGGLYESMTSNIIFDSLTCNWINEHGNVFEIPLNEVETYRQARITAYEADMTLYYQLCQLHSDYVYMHNYSGSDADPEDCGNHSSYEEHWLAEHGFSSDGTATFTYQINTFPTTMDGETYSGEFTYNITVGNPPIPANPETTMDKIEDVYVWYADYPGVTVQWQKVLDNFVHNPDVNIHIRDLSASRTDESCASDTNEFLTSWQKELIDQYEASQDTMAQYEAFIEMFNRGTDDANDGEMEEIVYRQCLITNQGEEDECWSEEYGDGRTTLTVANVYGYSNLYKITQPYLYGGDKYGEDLSVSDTYLILKKIQNYTGAYYDQVIQNMISLMIACANAEGDDGPLEMMNKDDPRVMPYDIVTMLPEDRENFAVTDPRVDIWRSHLLGNFVASLKVGGDVTIYFNFQPMIINFAGRITELSVFFQKVCDFDVWDEWGLSPTNLWQDIWITMVMGMLALFFIVSTVLLVLKQGSKGGIHALGAFLLLIFELGLMMYVATNPQSAWTKFKNAERSIVSLGTTATIGSDPDLAYLFGDDPDPAVGYYIPYLDCWSLYNTGYGIKADEQQIDEEADLPELVEINYPHIGEENVKQYSILLADSFSYYGESDSVVHSVLTATGETVNGTQINNNAYRVVDHFLAPRVTITKPNSSTVHLEVVENENYNGQFQSGFVDLILKLMLCCLYCFLSLIKFLTFVWFWLMMYLLFFRSIINKVEKKKFSSILIETLVPMLAMIMIDIYAGLIFAVTSELSGLFGFVFILFLFYMTFMFIRFWKGLSRGGLLLFPATLEPIYFITSFREMMRRHHADAARMQADRNAATAGVKFTDEEKNDYEKKTQRLFNADGSIANEFSNGKGGIDKKYEQIYLDYYKQGRLLQEHYGKELTFAQKSAQDRLIGLNASTQDEGWRSKMLQTEAQVQNQMKRPVSSATQEKLKALPGETQLEEPKPEEPDDAENQETEGKEERPKTKVEDPNEKIKGDKQSTDTPDAGNQKIK